MMNAVELMKHRWTAPRDNEELHFGNRLTPPFERGWGMLDGAMEEIIRRNSAKFFNLTRWIAAPLACGAGKSQFAITKAAAEAQKAPEEQRGILIVQEYIGTTNESAETIRALADGTKTAAVAYHHESKGALRLDDLQEYTTLCVTHAALLLALAKKEHAPGPKAAPKWERFTAFRGNYKRLLYIIDEEIALTAESRLDYNRVLRLLMLMTPSMQERFPDARKALLLFRDMFVGFQKMYKDRPFPDMNMTMTALPGAAIPPAALYELREAYRAESFYGPLGHRDSADEQRAHEDVDSTLSSISHLTASGSWMTHSGDKEKGMELLTSRSLLPENVSALILDGTSRQQEALYDLYKIDILDVPDNARNYVGSELHIARGRVGKGFMKKNAKAQTEYLMEDLIPRFEKEEVPPKVFVVVHKSVRPALAGFKPKSFEMLLSHWGETSGSNKYRDCSVGVLIGNPIKPLWWANQQIFAAIGQQGNAWHKGDHRWKGRTDLKRDVNDGVVVSEILQAAHRTTLRTVTENGGCPPTRIFCVLPEGEPGDRMETQILAALPGITKVPWILKGSGTSKYKRTEYEAALIEAFANMRPGVRVTAKTIQKDAGITSEKIWKKGLIPRIIGGDPKDTLTHAMKEHDVRYESAGKGSGRGNKASFIKQG